MKKYDYIYYGSNNWDNIQQFLDKWSEQGYEIYKFEHDWGIRGDGYLPLERWYIVMVKDLSPIDLPEELQK